MTDQHLDRIVRDVLADVAGQARPVPLLDGTVRRARHIKRRRAATAAGAVAVVVLALFAVPALAGGRGDPPVPSRPSPTAGRVPAPTDAAVPVPVLPVTPVPARVDLPGGFTVTTIGTRYTGGPGPAPLWVYDRAAGTFVATSYAYAAVAPSGTRAVVQTADSGSGVFLADIHDLTARPRRTIGAASSQMWSPNGQVVLDGSATPGWLHMLEIDTGARSDVQFRAQQVGCDADGLCGAAWYLDGSAVTVAVFDAATGKQTGTQVISADTGATITTLPVTGYIGGACSWSPDGRYVVTEIRSGTTGPWFEIVEVATGRRTARLPAMDSVSPNTVCWSSPTRLLVPDGGHVRVFGPDGRAGQDITVPGAAWVTVGPR